ncbi:MAG: hypothetical protein HC834_00955 [Rhodospirillales bacterium]|nr:hypothetical protein [Rhodospirillales bacterium]
MSAANSSRSAAGSDGPRESSHPPLQLVGDFAANRIERIHRFECVDELADSLVSSIRDGFAPHRWFGLIKPRVNQHRGVIGLIDGDIRAISSGGRDN